MSKARTYYKVFRSILFTTIIAVGVLYTALYVFLSVPPVQRMIKGIVQKELSSLLQSKLEIGSLDILPFNEVRLKNVVLYTPKGEKCISVGTLGAGINLWRLLSERKIEITYAEIIGLDGNVWQEEKDKPLNIQFILDAFSPNDKNKPPTKFDLMIHNIVIRRSALRYDQFWKPSVPHSVAKFDPSHIRITDLRADVTLPVVRNDDFVIDLRRLSFRENSGIDVDKISLKTHITQNSLSVKSLILNIGKSKIRTSDFTLHYPALNRIAEALDREVSLSVIGENLLPSDFSPFFPPLKNLQGIYYLDLSLEGSRQSFKISNLSLRDNRSGIKLETSLLTENLLTPEQFEISTEKFTLYLPSELIPEILDMFPHLPGKTRELIGQLGKIEVDAKGSFSFLRHWISVDGFLSSSIGEVKVDAEGSLKGQEYNIDSYSLEVKDFDLGTLFHTDKIGLLTLNSSGNLSGKGKDINGKIQASVDMIDVRGHRITDIMVDGIKHNKDFGFTMEVNDPSTIMEMEGYGVIDPLHPSLSLRGDITSFRPNSLGFLPKYGDSEFSGDISVDIAGTNFDNLLGSINISDVVFRQGKEAGNKLLRISNFGLSIVPLQSDNDSIQSKSSPLPRRAMIESDFINGEITGTFPLSGIKNTLSLLMESAIPGILATSVKNDNTSSGAFNVNLSLLPKEDIYNFLKLPIKPLTSVTIAGTMDTRTEAADITLSAPYLLQGSNKLISGTNIGITGTINTGLQLKIASTLPVKKDRLSLMSSVSAKDGKAKFGIDWQSENDVTANGHIEMDGIVGKNSASKEFEALLHILPSQFHLGFADWNVSESSINYQSSKLSVDGLRIWHADQYLDINGVASASAEDSMNISLKEIDLGYIFGVLNINYVTFGGYATGEISASEVFSKNPVAQTRRLSIRDFSYNDAHLGDAEIFSRWNNEEKAVEISADVTEKGVQRAVVNGGVFVTRDSLDFSMQAKKVKIEFLKPFMAAFTSDVGGRASGDIRLYGNFKDIDLIGKAFADSIYMKVDYTNVYYHGSDSVYLNPGKIIIPSFSLKDKYGHEGIFSGVVRHRYFHDPEFEFKLSNAGSILCYDTDASINPDWYGRIYASGGGSLWGRPGIVALMMDMTTDKGSDFTFVLNETQTAADYTFLTFSDRRKEEEFASIQVEENIEERFRNFQDDQTSKPTVFNMDLRATITPDARMNLVMDPKTGDRIIAHGSGPLQISYNTESEEMKMYGKYTLVEGDYKFNLQDLILRDFVIKEGSNISFNGDPLRALLDVTAAYRVNTNLSDLDKSFSSDKDLNRTNVPVDAILNVRGDLENPEITFDIELPTLTSDVARKVRSIISTDEMMNRQIIYLLALNRFYTPEYMGGSSNGGGELASVASSTISSQLSNIVGSLTDKVSFMPAIRSDKGDFSDMEVDLTLSSRLLNNRLLINGNFGYRDKNTSQTTFVGDFDIEYLLNNSGNLRLKAYNHFNDQYYYLKSALTTQGIGVLYRKEFDNPFTFLRRKKKNQQKRESEETLSR